MSIIKEFLDDRRGWLDKDISSDEESDDEIKESGQDDDNEAFNKYMPIIIGKVIEEMQEPIYDEDSREEEEELGVMNVIQGLLSAVSPLSDGDGIDRLNYCVTTVALVVTSAFISGWSFVGSPIQCWFPAYYKGWWMEYALDFCYVQNTYYVPMTDKKVSNAFEFGSHMVEIPKNYTDRETTEIGYYQWVPFILAGQALLFYIPVVLWRAIYESTGFKVRTICDVCSISGNMDIDTRHRNMKTVASFLTQEHIIASNIGSSIKRFTSGSSIVYSYLVIKFLYALNAIVQFIALKSLLGVDSLMWGFDVISNQFMGIEWKESGLFPRVTMCDYDVRVLGNLHRHSVQCAMMINMFNEKIFVAIWFWLLALIAINIYSFIQWIIISVPTNSGRRFVKQFIQMIDPSVARSLHKRSLLQQFVVEKLRPDGVFITRLVAVNSGEQVVGSLLKTLWDDFVRQRGEHPPPYSEPLLVSAKKIDDDDL